MKKSLVLSCTLLLICLALALGANCYAEESSGSAVVLPENGGAAFAQIGLKKQCLAATITAINLEIGRHQRWLDWRQQQSDPKGVEELQQSLAGLKADLAKYQAMDARDFKLPAKTELVGWFGDKAGENSVLYFSGMTKCGPWYHLAGVAGGDYSVLRPNTNYRMTIYSVYPRSYWGMDSAYIYIHESIPQATQEKRITGEVFAPNYINPAGELFKCDDYKVYLLKDIQPGSKGELVLAAQKSDFDFTLSAEKLNAYSYLEFVSSFGSATIKLADIKDEPLNVVLDQNMYLKKPAIYLYPEQKSKIEIVHNFKGKLLTTYPAYTNNWTVIADPDGNLLNTKDNRYYRYLFWDGVYAFSNEHYQYKSGFYVKNEDYVSFLRSKLTTIGLSEAEINDFIVYWLPAMNKYKNCFVHFRINDDIGGSSVLITTPAPETTIRVFMEFSGVSDIEAAAKLPEQQLPVFIRKGFTLVEWGGAEIGGGKIE